MLTYADQQLLSRLEQDMNDPVDLGRRHVAERVGLDMVTALAKDEARSPSEWALAEWLRCRERLSALELTEKYPRRSAASRRSAHGGQASLASQTQQTVKRMDYLDRIHPDRHAAPSSEMTITRTTDSHAAAADEIDAAWKITEQHQQRFLADRAAQLRDRGEWAIAVAVAFGFLAAVVGEAIAAIAICLLGYFIWAIFAASSWRLNRRRQARVDAGSPQGEVKPIPTIEQVRQAAEHASDRDSVGHLRHTQYAVMCDQPEEQVSRIAVVEFRPVSARRYTAVMVPGSERRFTGDQLVEAATFRVECEQDAAARERNARLHAERFAATVEHRRQQLKSIEDDRQLQAQNVRELIDALNGHQTRLL